jgi:hypothetical protein
MVVLRLFRKHIEELAEGWLDAEGEAKPRRGDVPLATVLGSDLIPAQAGATLSKALRKMAGRGEIDAGAKWQALERWARAYLEGEP